MSWLRLRWSLFPLAITVLFLASMVASTGLPGVVNASSISLGRDRLSPATPVQEYKAHFISSAPSRRLADAPFAGVYAFNDGNHLSPAVYPVYGGHKLFYWYDLEPWADDGYDWGLVERWIETEISLGKPVGIGVNGYDGICCGGDLTPPWVYEEAPDAVLMCHEEWAIPKYWHPLWLAAWEDMIRDLGARYDGDPRLSWVVISTGMYGENWPADAFWHADCLDGAGLTSDLWLQTMKQIVDIYDSAFSQTTLLLQFAPVYKLATERREITEYAALKGIGLKHNGLWPDANGAVIDDPGKSYYQAGQYDPFLLWGDQVPTGWEGQEYQLTGDVGTLWGMYNGLDKHPDYMLLGEEITTNPSRRPMLEFAQTYLGRTLEDTPSVWVALREHDPDWLGQQSWFPQRGNYSFWLYQLDDAPGGQTVAEWNVSMYPEGRWTRRTNQAAGQPRMVFDVDNGYFFDGGEGEGVRVEVTYYDLGEDRWALEYDGASGPSLAGVVRKGDTGLWLTEAFTLPDARFADGLAGGGDFHVDCMGDGDEYIHFVEVTMLPDLPPPMPEPVPTGSPPGLPPTLTPTPPVVVVVLQQGVDGYSGSEDATLSRWAAGVPHPDDPLLELRSERNGPEDNFTAINNIQSAVIRFDLAALPSDAIVQDATLHLHVVDRSFADARQRVSAYELLRAWDEAQVTWTQPMSGEWWSEAGANGEGSDRATARTDVRLLHEVGITYDFHLTPLVQEWLSRPSSNRGFLLRDISVKNVSFSVASSEHPQAEIRPRMMITYTLPSWLTPSPTASPTATPSATLTPTPSGTPTATFTPSATATASPTGTFTPSPTALATATPTLIPTMAGPRHIYLPLLRASGAGISGTP